MISRSIVNSGRIPVSRLGDVADFLDSQRRPVTESDRISGSYPYFGANGQQGTINDYIFDEPLVLLAEDGGFFDNPDRGIAYRIAGKTWVNNHAHVLRPRHGVDEGYLCRVLENYDVAPFVTGTTRGKLTKGSAEQIPIPLPPLEEQRRIAAILDQADSLRTKRRQTLAELNTLTQSIFLEMFGDPATNPYNFPLHPLEGLCAQINDCPHTTPKWSESGMICLRTSNLMFGGWNWADTRYVSRETFDERSKRGALEPGDIVLSREGTVGIAAIVEENMKLCMGQRLVQVRAAPENCVPEYLLAHLLHVLAPQRIGRSMVGSTAQHLNVKELRSLRVPKPPLGSQVEFKKLVARINRLAEDTAASAVGLDLLFSSLQQRAFRGAL